MASLQIRDETYRRLALKAAARNTTIEALVMPALESLAEGPTAAPLPTPREHRRAAFEAWQSAVQERVGLYLPSHRVDDGRDAIYDGPDGRGA